MRRDTCASRSPAACRHWKKRCGAWKRRSARHKRHSLTVWCRLSDTLAAAALSPAGATNINTSAVACQQAVFQAVPSDKQNRVGIIDSGVVNMTNVPTIVICPVPRSPLAAGATSGGFWLDGDNLLNSLVTVQTTCNVASYTYQGVLHGWSGFTATEATYDRFVSLPASMLGFYDYVSVNCVLPPYHDALRTYLGVFRGVTASQ